MKFLVCLLLLSLTVTGLADEAAAALQRFESLKRQALPLNAKSSRAEIGAALGKAETTGTGAWNRMETEVWFYLDLHR